jgi:OmpA-OmpF porin, OOP family
VQLGVDERLIEVRARGDAVPIESCSAGTRNQQDLQECLLPNRRVDVQIDARQQN